MIYGRLYGGLGNQLFQIFTTIAYSIRNKQPFQFPAVLNQGKVDRPDYWSSMLSRLKIFTTRETPTGMKVTEKGHHYEELSPLLSSGSDTVILDGYFQSRKYFADYEESICRMIGLDAQRERVREKYDEYDYGHMISMHFRLGDYKNLSAFHNILPVTYYQSALAHIMRTVDEAKKFQVLYFCEVEDNDIVEQKITEIRQVFPSLSFVKSTNEPQDWEQMLMMSLCAHHVIANSTFSWWGANLSQNPTKVVCYPEEWFGPNLRHLDIKDLFPQEWHQIAISES
jgi:hypothetical protein